MEWREIADKPADEDAAMTHIKGVIAGRIERLEEMIALHQEIAGQEAIERADAASFDPGPEAERLRRSRTAKGRELRQTLELFLKMQAARENGRPSPRRARWGRGRRDQGCANEAESGGRMGGGEAGQGAVEEDLELTTEGTENTEGEGGRRAAG